MTTDRYGHLFKSDDHKQAMDAIARDVFRRLPRACGFAKLPPMGDSGLSEFRSFAGQIAAEGHSYALRFHARIDPAGELEFDLGTLQLSEANKFVFLGWKSEDNRTPNFALSGTAEDGTTFETSNLHFRGMNTTSNAEGTTFMAKAQCAIGTFRRTLVSPAPIPLLRMHLKGFRNFGELQTQTPLGKLTMAGSTEIPEPNTIAGWIALRPNEPPSDLAAWRAEGEKLMEHVRQVLSFAASAMLRPPVMEFYAGESLELTTRSQTRQTISAMPVFHFLNQRLIFEAAVRSYYEPPIKGANLFFAIEWFAMDASYTEVRLINAMTALEYLVESNLGESDQLIQPRNAFDKSRRVLRGVICACLAKWQPTDADAVLPELDEKLADLNRRSLLRKLDLLAQRWNVPLDDIGRARIAAAKRARDWITHRGQYYKQAKEGDPGLWEHVTIVREVVARFLLAAIGFEGGYLSYVGGYHDAQFPRSRSARY